MCGQRRFGKQAGVENSEQQSGEGDGVGEAHRFRVHDGEAEEEEAEEGHADACETEAESQEAEQEESGGRELDSGVAPGDGVAAGAATSAEECPAQERNVVAGSDRRAAVGATGARADDGEMLRQATDADIEEAAEGESEEDDEDGGEDGRGLAPGNAVSINGMQ